MHRPLVPKSRLNRYRRRLAKRGTDTLSITSFSVTGPKTWTSNITPVRTFTAAPFDCAAGAVMASSAPQWLPGSAFAGISSEKGSVISCFGAIFRSGYAGFNHAFSEFVASSRSTVACPSSSWGPISAPSRCTGRSASVPFQNLKELSTWSPVYGIQLIAPHRLNRKNRTQDLRRLRRYGRRWKIERLFAWLQNFRRLVVRYERYAENFLGMLHLGCCLILLRHI